MFYSQMLESLVSLFLLLVCVSLIKKGYKRGEGGEKREGKTERGRKKERKGMIIWQGMCKHKSMGPRVWKCMVCLREYVTVF